ncbi:guanine nucleotide-binding protein alpha-1 subunit-like [Aegilops tauschii subsp. strangulata]|uniref:Guanine nucleotide-binding protein alpha subunit n=1 Tax=Aegilops tauschii TaxID=37682 RepID=R7WEK9_AEGTA|nr:guanine nucleotide-binding protein alpha-1 subunit-like [Triticum aestivum]
MATPQRLLRSPEPSTTCSPTTTPSSAPTSLHRCAPHHHANDTEVKRAVCLSVHTPWRDKIGGEVYRLYDVGGQRSERRKWIHLFEGVNVVITCAAIREYDHLLLEDKTPNRMMETKELFDWVLKQRCLEKTSFMLFLNKFDIFERKIQKVSLTVCEWFKDYEPIAPGKVQDVEHPYEFVKKKFEEVFKSSKHDHIDRVFKIYKTMALDRKLLKKTFRLIDKSMRRSKEGNRSVIDHSVLKFKWNFSH